jgi:hypothetical protein
MFRRRNRDSPTPSLGSECGPPLGQVPKVGGDTRLRVRGWGSPNSDAWRKGLALCLLCVLFLTPPPSPSHGDYYLSLRLLEEEEGGDHNLYILYSAYTVDLTLNFELVKKETKVNSLKKEF